MLVFRLLRDSHVVKLSPRQVCTSAQVPTGLYDYARFNHVHQVSLQGVGVLLFSGKDVSTCFNSDQRHSEVLIHESISRKAAGKSVHSYRGSHSPSFSGKNNILTAPICPFLFCFGFFKRKKSIRKSSMILCYKNSICEFMS